MDQARADHAKAFLLSVAGAGQNSLESGFIAEAFSQGPDDVAESLLPHEVPEGLLGELVVRTAEKVVRNIPLDAEEGFALESIIIPDKRPALDVFNNGNFTTSHPLWISYVNDAEIYGRLKGAMPSIGRVELPGNPRIPYGGTGFVVGEGLLMTNRHVASLFAEGLGTRQLAFSPGVSAGIDFLRERDGGSDPLTVTSVVMIHPYWDMALLRVEGLPAVHAPLRLSRLDPADIAGRKIAVIGYPAEDPYIPADVQFKVFRGLYNIKRLQPGLVTGRRDVKSFEKTVSALTHDSSTLGGNSGSAVIDVITGEVLALHFGGRYLDSNFGVPACELARDSRIVDAGVRFSDGVLPSGDSPWKDYWVAADGGGAPPPPGAERPAPAAVPSGPVPAHPVKWVVPLEITVSIGGAQSVGDMKLTTGGEAQVQIERAVEPFHDSEEIRRDGYQESFLGVTVPLPNATDLSLVAKLEDGGHVVPYHHFSIVMHKKRRLALFTAANVDARPGAKQPEPGQAYTRKGLSGLGKNDIERWFPDGRLRGSDQLPDRFFDKDRKAFDKGHLVRREDVAWGRSYDEVRAANGDTYFTTNCSPQVAGFNRSNHDDNWGALEDLVLGQAKNEPYCLFSGPILDPGDPEFSGVDDLGKVRIQIPRRFWKVVVAAKPSAPGGLEAFAFILGQSLADVQMEFVVTGGWKDYLVSIPDLERQLGIVVFAAALHRADQYAVLKG